MEFFIPVSAFGSWFIIGLVIALFAFIDDECARDPRTFTTSQLIWVFALSAVFWPVTLFFILDWYRKEYISGWHNISIVVIR